MNRNQADLFIARMGFPGLVISKAEGVWYIIGDEGVVNHNVERCLHVVRLSDLTERDLRWKVQELTQLESAIDDVNATWHPIHY